MPWVCCTFGNVFIGPKSKSKLFGEGHLCLRITSATLLDAMIPKKNSRTLRSNMKVTFCVLNTGDGWVGPKLRTPYTSSPQLK